MSRILLFLPSYLFLAVVFIVSYFYFGVYLTKTRTVRNSKQWLLNNQRGLFWYMVMPGSIIMAPAGEELVCRGILLILFPVLNTGAWLAIIVLSLGFGIVHVLVPQDPYRLLAIRSHDSSFLTDDMEVLTRHYRTLAECGKIEDPVNWISKLSRFFGTSLLSLIVGYLAIVTQSVLTAFAFHVLWNLTAISIMILISRLDQAPLFA